MTILAATTGTNIPSQVVRQGYDLASAYGDELVVLHVAPESEFEKHQSELQTIDEFKDYSVIQEEDSIADFAEQVAKESLDEPFDGVSGMGRVGDPADRITRAADSLNARYIVIGARKRSPTGKALFGSTTQAVLLSSTCPVVTVLRD